MKLPDSTKIGIDKLTGYLLIRQSRNDKSVFLALGGYTFRNPERLLADLTRLRESGEANLAGENRFGRYFEITGWLPGAVGIALEVKTIWMTEHLSGLTRFITLIPIKAAKP